MSGVARGWAIEIAARLAKEQARRKPQDGLFLRGTVHILPAM